MLTAAPRRRWLQGIAAGVVLVIAGAFSTPPAHAASPAEEAETFLHDLAISGVAMLEKGSYTEAEREMEFRRLVRKGFALEAIGKFVAGRYWAKMSPAEQTEYQELFSEWLLKTYAGRLGGYSGERLEIIKSIETDSRYKDVIVSTRVIRGPGQPPINADWRLRKVGADYKIIDVAVEGASMVGTQRREFESVIQKVGVSGLIDNLRDRLAVLMANTG